MKEKGKGEIDKKSCEECNCISAPTMHYDGSQRAILDYIEQIAKFKGREKSTIKGLVCLSDSNIESINHVKFLDSLRGLSEREEEWAQQIFEFREGYADKNRLSYSEFRCFLKNLQKIDRYIQDGIDNLREKQEKSNVDKADLSNLYELRRIGKLKLCSHEKLKEDIEKLCDYYGSFQKNKKDGFLDYFESALCTEEDDSVSSEFVHCVKKISGNDKTLGDKKLDSASEKDACSELSEEVKDALEKFTHFRNAKIKPTHQHIYTKDRMLDLLRIFSNGGNRKSDSSFFKFLNLLEDLDLLKEDYSPFQQAISYIEMLPPRLLIDDLKNWLSKIDQGEYLPKDFFSARVCKNCKENGYGYPSRSSIASSFLFRSKFEDGTASGRSQIRWNEKWSIDSSKPPNNSQIEAINTALENTITIIQGPPGTGKTETILNLLVALKHKGSTAAVVSPNNTAILNVTQKIEENSISSDSGMMLEKAYIQLGGKTFREKLDEEKTTSNNYKKIQLLYKENTENDKNKENDKKLANLLNHKAIIDKVDTKRYQFVASTINSLPRCMEYDDDFLFDYVIVDESSQANILHGLLAMNYARRLVVIGDDNQLPPVFEDVDRPIFEELNKNLLGENFCNPHIAMHNANLSFLTACTLAFNPPSIMLKEHYRCHSSIIQFCNNEVYGGRLIKSGVRKGGTECKIAIRWYEGNYGRGTDVSKGAYGSHRQSITQLKKEYEANNDFHGGRMATSPRENSCEQEGGGGDNCCDHHSISRAIERA